MEISECGQITRPKPLRDQFGMHRDVEVVITPTEKGLLIQKRASTQHPVDRVYGILGTGRNTDEYIKEIRGR